jgi:hypothetical protein
MESFRRNLSENIFAKPESFRIEFFRKNLSGRNLSEKIFQNGSFRNDFMTQ